MKLKDLKRKKEIVETNYENLYVHNLSLNTVQELTELTKDADQDGDVSVLVNAVVFVLENMACDKDGEPFEDVSKEEIATWDVRDLNDILEAVSDVFKTSRKKP